MELTFWAIKKIYSKITQFIKPAVDFGSPKVVSVTDIIANSCDALATQNKKQKKTNRKDSSTFMCLEITSGNINGIVLFSIAVPIRPELKEINCINSNQCVRSSFHVHIENRKEH